MIAGAINTKRHQIIAPMGSGKTGAVLGLANLLSAQRQRWPGLTAFAPLQVALNWRNEAPLWAPRQSVALVAGTLAERKKAVMSDADIMLVTYDSVQWMDEFVGGKWNRFGAMAIGDESSRVKSTRAYIEADGSIVTTGGPRTNALARHAADFEWWLNLTGTPVPNGLTDLWGQYFYVDGGQRLMRTYSAFLARWFKSPTRWDDFRKPMPLPGALIEITHAVKDVTTVLKVEDWFKLDKPRFVDRWVELPAKAMKQYQDMDISMIMELSSGNIAEVESGSARVAKCLQIASGFAYYKDDTVDPDANQVEYLHEVKLDALDSIIEETGENLVVVYFFKAQLAQLKARYKDRLRTLDAKGVAQDDWNAGKIELLAVQYSQGSLGISLQHGGRSIVLLAPTNRQEDYEQIIERLGPMRQMQSGYNRVVNVYRILARGTRDKTVFDNTEAKGDFQELTKKLLAEPRVLV